VGKQTSRRTVLVIWRSVVGDDNITISHSDLNDIVKMSRNSLRTRTRLQNFQQAIKWHPDFCYVTAVGYSPEIARIPDLLSGFCAELISGFRAGLLSGFCTGLLFWFSCPVSFWLSCQVEFYLLYLRFCIFSGFCASSFALRKGVVLTYGSQFFPALGMYVYGVYTVFGQGNFI
jgi:hypothetical protein